jgi:hypothetical protein
MRFTGLANTIMTDRSGLGGPRFHASSIIQALNPLP